MSQDDVEEVLKAHEKRISCLENMMGAGAMKRKAPPPLGSTHSDKERRIRAPAFKLTGEQKKGIKKHIYDVLYKCFF